MLPPPEIYDHSVALVDINRGSTVLAAVFGCMATVGAGLLTIGILLSNDWEPDCGVRTARNADYCGIGADDYGLAAPCAVVFLVALLFTTWLYRRSCAPPAAAVETRRQARSQARTVFGISTLAAFSFTGALLFVA